MTDDNNTTDGPKPKNSDEQDIPEHLRGVGGHGDFFPIGPEDDGGLVVCANCGRGIDIRDAEYTIDDGTQRPDDSAWFAVQRMYVCSESCMSEVMYRVAEDKAARGDL